MRLAQKFTLALVVVMTLAVGVRSVLDAQRSIDHHEARVRAAQREIGQVMSAAVVRIWKQAGWEHALAYLEEVEAQQGDMEIRWTWLEPQELEVYRPKVDAKRLRAELEAHRAGEGARVATPELPGHVVTYWPVRLPDLPLGAIELTQSTAPQEAWVRAEQRHAVLGSLLVILAYALVASVLGRLLVGRPIDELVGFARRVGEGRFEVPNTVHQADEIGALAEEMNEMSVSLQRANDEASQEREAREENERLLIHADRLAATGRLAAAVVHDIATPLNVISGRAQMIVDGDLPAEAAPKTCEKIVAQVDRISEMTRSLLDHARKGDASRVDVDVGGLLGEVDDLVGTVAAKSDVTVTIARPAEPLVVRASRSELRQVLSNLVVNAIQAMPNGGQVTLRARPEDAGPEGAIAEPQGWALLEIEDEGTGIPEDVLEDIFEPFFTTKPEGEGTGLGLAVCRRILRSHGGDIAARSELGRGTTMRLWLPRASAQDE